MGVISRSMGARFFLAAAVVAALVTIAGFLFAPHSEAAPTWRQRREFISGLRGEMRQLEQTLKAEMSDLKSSQKERRDSSEREARTQRRECFKQASRGSEKRTCVQTLLERRKALVNELKDEMRQRKDEHRDRRRRLEEEHRRRLADFDQGGSGAPAPLSGEPPSSAGR